MQTPPLIFPHFFQPAPPAGNHTFPAGKDKILQKTLFTAQEIAYNRSTEPIVEQEE
jgi:hypothetical protein